MKPLDRNISVAISRTEYLQTAADEDVMDISVRLLHQNREANAALAK